MEKELTKRQKSILDFIIEFVREHNFAPTLREIGSELGIRSTRGVHRHLETLEKKGYIKRKATPRSIKILNFIDNFMPSKPIINVPLVGVVAAGSPILAQQNIEDVLPVTLDFIKNARDGFLLRVKGDSMIDDGIHNGDMVAVAPQPYAENGDIVVAMIEDEATVKRYYKEKDHIKLQPANKSYRPILVRRDFRVLGIVTGLMRRYNGHLIRKLKMAI